MKTLLSVGLWVTLLVMVGCTSGPQLLPESMLASQAAAQFNQMKAEVPVSQDGQANARLSAIGDRVIATVAEEMPHTNWEVVLFDSPQVNAFAMPGGKIGFYRGLVELAETDAQLATVMAHEVAHVLRGHSNQQMTAAMLGSAGQAVAGVLAQQQDRVDPALISQAAGISLQLGLLKYSRVHEYEADEIGLLLMAEAGYDPRQALVFWEKMQAMATGTRPPEWFSTHPKSENRMERLQARMSEALEIYENSRNS